MNMKALAQKARPVLVSEDIQYVPRPLPRLCHRVAGQHPRLGLVAANLVGPPHPGLVLHRV